MPEFLEECTGCGACREACPILSKCGTPDEILSKHPEMAFYCTLCRCCDEACPLGISPTSGLFAVKERLLKEGRVPESVRKPLNKARSFAKTGHRFPFAFYECAQTVFWPGCGLAANSPDVVIKSQKILSRHRHEDVGLVLDCCYAPVLGFGDTETTGAAFKEINQILREGGVRRVITGCLKCHRLLLEYLDGIEVVFILEELSGFIGLDIPSSSDAALIAPIYLHHPCPAEGWVQIEEEARDMAARLWPFHGENNEASAARCCGAGGALSVLSPELADCFLERIIEEGAGRRIVTYCVGCQNRFLKKGVEAVHLLEGLTGEEPRRHVPTSLARWSNRLLLAMKARLKAGRLLAGLIVVLLFAAGVYLHHEQVISVEALLALLNRHPVLAPVIFIGVYAVAPVLLLPSIPLTLAAGFFWGPVWGVVYTICAATMGSCLPFFLARYLFQDAVKSRVAEQRWRWLQERVRQHGWKAVAFTRLIPVFPFNLLNYLYGLTPISFGQYLWSTFVFMLPACIAFVAFGSSLGELIMKGNIRGVVIGVIVAVCALLLAAALRPFFRKLGESKTESQTRQKENG